MKEYLVKECNDKALQGELNGLCTQGWTLYKLECCSANDDQYRFWMIIVFKELSEDK